MKLPIGYRFHPTDEELVVHYLKKKSFALPLPASIIPQLDDVFLFYPWTLPGDLKETRYFFSKRSSDSEGSNCYNNNNGMNDKKKRKRSVNGPASSCGYWKTSGKERKILDSLTNEPVGLRKTLVFYTQSTHHHFGHNKTRWVMHEYRILENQTRDIKKTWVVYKLFQKKRKDYSIIAKSINKRPSFVDITMESSSPSPCYSEISHDVASNRYLVSDLDHENEEISSA